MASGFRVASGVASGAVRVGLESVQAWVRCD